MTVRHHAGILFTAVALAAVLVAAAPAQAHAQAMPQEPDSAAAFYDRGVAFLNQGRYDRAVADLSAALRLDPGSAATLNKRGLAYRNMHEYASAVEDFEQALRLDPRHLDALNNLALLYAASADLQYRDGKQALAYARRALAIRKNPSVLSTLAAALARDGQFKEAVQAQEEALARLDAQKDASPQMRQWCAERLAQYKAGQPYTVEMRSPAQPELPAPTAPDETQV